MKLKLPKKKLFQAALKNNNWPVNWFDPKKDKEKELICVYYQSYNCVGHGKYKNRKYTAPS